MFSRKFDVIVVASSIDWCHKVCKNLHDKHHRYSCYSSLADARQEVLSRTTAPDVVIIEVSSNTTGRAAEFITQFRAMARTQYMPIILVLNSPRDDVDEALHMELTDFMIQPVDPEQLLYRTAANIRTRDALRQLELKNKLLERLAAYDDLTGLYNRRSFLEALKLELEKLPNEGLGMAVYLIDLDGFKDINDTCGHLVGDRILKGFADHLRHCLRPQDVIGRLGGDEFCLIQTEIDFQHSMALADRLIDCISKHECPLEQFNLPPVSVRASIGGAFVPAGASIRCTDILACADEALYSVKGNGRNGYLVREVAEDACRS